MTEIKNTDSIKLCSLDEIPDNAARGFMVDNDGSAFPVFVINKDGQVFAYQNRCPHMGTSLDWQADQFLDSSGKLIQCATHGALFRIEDGLCVYGPCANQSLSNVPTQIRENAVFIFPALIE